MTNMNQLPKPCPFCGEKVVWVKQTDDVFTVTCPVCVGTGPEGDSIDDAVNGWNMRSGPGATTLAADEDGLWRVG